MKKLFAVVSVMAISIAMSGCGGGGTSGSADVSSEYRSVDGGVYASIVANATVCLEDAEGNILTNNDGEKICAQSDANGTFSLQVPPSIDLSITQVALYVKDQNGDEIKIGETDYNTALADNTTDVIVVTPLALADNNETLADDIGALIHALGGDINGNATEIDLGNVDIENVTVVDTNGTELYLTDDDKSLEELIKEKHKIRMRIHHDEVGTVEVDMDPTNSTASVSCKLDNDEDNEFEEEKIVSYNATEKEEEWKEHLQELLEKFNSHEEENEHQEEIENATEEEQLEYNENSTEHQETETEEFEHSSAENTTAVETQQSVEQSENSTIHQETEETEQTEHSEENATLT
ncbi:hypothetical protein [Desulfurobacterium crinifex]